MKYKKYNVCVIIPCYQFIAFTYVKVMFYVCFDVRFSISLGVAFPRNFITVAKTILKRLFRVYAHVYHAHFDHVLELHEEVGMD